MYETIVVSIDWRYIMKAKVNRELTGKNIKRLCEDRNISIKDLQKSLELKTAVTIYKWYEGKSMPNIRIAVTLADVLNVKIDELYVMDYLD